MPKILVVDDEASIVNLLTSYLKAEGYEVYTAADGPTGLKAAKAFKPDVIILDIMLPGLDGLEVLARLRREFGCLRHLIDRPHRGDGQDHRAFGRRRRLRHQTVQPAGTDGPPESRPAPPAGRPLARKRAWPN